MILPRCDSGDPRKKRKMLVHGWPLLDITAETKAKIKLVVVVAFIDAGTNDQNLTVGALMEKLLSSVPDHYPQHDKSDGSVAPIVISRLFDRIQCEEDESRVVSCWHDFEHAILRKYVNLPFHEDVETLATQVSVSGQTFFSATASSQEPTAILETKDSGSAALLKEPQAMSTLPPSNGGAELKDDDAGNVLKSSEMILESQKETDDGKHAPFDSDDDLTRSTTSTIDGANYKFVVYFRKHPRGRHKFVIPNSQ